LSATSPRISRLRIFGFLAVFVAVVAESLAYARDQMAGDASLLGVAASAVFVAWIVGRHVPRELIWLGAVFGAFACYVIGYAHYFYLYWLRAMFLANFNLFQYFGSLYALLVQVAALACALAGALGTLTNRRTT
jgi:hypothetical protein